MKRILITGISGFLGHYLALNKPEKYGIVGLYHKNRTPQSVKSVSCDLSDKNQIHKVLAEAKPDGIIHTAAISNPAHCQQNPEYSRQINIEASVLLAKYAADNGIPLVFTSSDLVFDGEKGNYFEGDVANPLNIYGEQKLIAENEILHIYPKVAVCRMPLMLGNVKGFSEKYLQKFLATAKNNESISLFTDEFRSPLGGNSAAKGLWLALDTMNGLYHMGGAQRLSRFELGIIIADKFGVDKKLLKAVKQSDLNLKTPRPKDVSLDSSKAAELGFSPTEIAIDLD